jgi:hypothetical protein
MIVYWSVTKPSEDIYLGLDEPKPVIADFKETANLLPFKQTRSDFTRCPSVIDYSKNMFSIKSPTNIGFVWDGNEVHFDDSIDKDFLAGVVLPREIKSGMLSLRIMPYVFLAEDSCEMHLTGPNLCINNFVDTCTVVPGQFNVGKWFRPLDFGFFIRQQHREVLIAKGDTIANIRFLTDEPITFKKFYLTPTCEDIINNVVSFKKSQRLGLKNYFTSMYNDFHTSKLRKILMKEIKNNLLD